MALCVSPHLIFTLVTWTRNSVNMSILKMRKLRVKNIKHFVQDHTGRMTMLRSPELRDCIQLGPSCKRGHVREPGSTRSFWWSDLSLCSAQRGHQRWSRVMPGLNGFLCNTNTRQIPKPVIWLRRVFELTACASGWLFLQRFPKNWGGSRIHSIAAISGVILERPPQCLRMSLSQVIGIFHWGQHFPTKPGDLRIKIYFLLSP